MKKSTSELYQLFASVQSEAEAKLLLKDICTPQEIEQLAERWQIVQELAKGTAQRKIAKKTGASISTVTRGSIAFQHGNKGFLHFLKKLEKV